MSSNTRPGFKNSNMYFKLFSVDLYEIVERSKGYKSASGIDKFPCIQRNTTK